jgi:hypothetical protein
MSADEIPCHQIEVRGVERRFFAFVSAVSRIRDEAFLPGKSGKDNDGLSVTAYRDGVLEIIRRMLGDPNRNGATLHVGRVRTINVDGLMLDVKPDPIEGQDPYHALVCGFPPRSPGEGLAVTRVCERLAEKLAKQARPL